MHVMTQVNKGNRVEVKSPKNTADDSYFTLYFGVLKIWIRRDHARTIADALTHLLQTMEHLPRVAQDADLAETDA